jgi:hypothetical protein
MEIRRLDPQTVALAGLDPFACALLRQIIPSAAPGDNAAARARLFSSPTGGAEPEFDEDWRAWVEPDLHEHFQSSLSLVESDLAELPAEATEEPAELQIPVEHLDSWINALNQARLALAARHEITERDMESELLLGDARGFALFQVEFYGSLQFCFIRELEKEKGT